MSVSYCGSMLELGSQVRKFFEGLGWFSVEVFGGFLMGRTTKCILSDLLVAKNKMGRLVMSQ